MRSASTAYSVRRSASGFENGGLFGQDRCSKHGCEVEYFFVCDGFQAG